LKKESVTRSTENPRIGGSIPSLNAIHKKAQHKLGLFMYGVQDKKQYRIVTLSYLFIHSI